MDPLLASAPAPLTPPGQLELERRDDASGTTLIIRGEIDVASAPALEHELREAESPRPRRLVLDCAALDFIDSSGIHLLLRAQQRAEAGGHELVLARVPGHARRLFGLTGADARLAIA